jgi:zinc protease
MMAIGVPTTSCRKGRSAVRLSTPDIGCESYVLANGMRVILHQDAGFPAAHVGVWYRAGAGDDPPGREGVAHIVEHLMFGRTRHLAAGEALRLLGETGADGAARTETDFTRYTEAVSASELPLVLWMESSRMGFLLPQPAAALEKALTVEKEIVANEVELRVAGAFRLPWQRLKQTLYAPGHPYAHEELGSPESIARITGEDVQAFYAAHYGASTALLIIAGTFDVQATRALIEKYFGSLPGRPRPAAELPPGPAWRGGQQRVTLEGRLQAPELIVAWPMAPSYQPGSEEGEVAAEILGGSLSRLRQRLDPVARWTRVWQERGALAGVLVIRIILRPGHEPDEALAIIDEEVRSLRDRPLPLPDLERTKNSIIASRRSELASLPTRALRLAEDALLADDPNALSHSLTRLQRIEPSSLQAWARRYLTKARVIVESHPAADAPREGRVVGSTPSPSKVAPPAAHARAGDGPLTGDAPYRYRRPDPRPEVGPPLAGKRFTLRNGLPVVLIESHVLPLVSARLVVFAGNASSPPGRPAAATLTAALLERGTNSRSGSDRSRALELLGARVEQDVDLETSHTTLLVGTEQLVEALPIWARSVTRPDLEENAFEETRYRLLQSMRDQIWQPEIVMGTFAMSYLGGWPARRRDLHYAGLTQASLEGIKIFHREHYRPERAALIVSGDLRELEARPLLENAFGDWTARGKPPLPLLPPPMLKEPRTILIALPGTSQATLRLMLPAPGRGAADYPAVQVMNDVLGGPWKRLERTLRLEKGWAYQARSFLFPLSSSGLWLLEGTFATSRTSEAHRRILQELRSLGTDLVSPEKWRCPDGGSFVMHACISSTGRCLPDRSRTRPSCCTPPTI